MICVIISIMNIKKPLVFIHGWGVSSETWESLRYFLQNDFEIFSLDLPGFGKTPIEKIMTLKDYADFVYNFLIKNNISNPIVIGHSFGGAVAAKFTLLYPDKISKLILVGAAIVRQPSMKTKIFRKISGIFSPFLPPKIKMVILKIFGLENSDYIAIQSPLLKETFKNIINENLLPDLPKIKIPTLVIWGNKDIETPLEQGKLIAENIPGTKLVIVKNAGHFLFLEKPTEFAKLIKEFTL